MNEGGLEKFDDEMSSVEVERMLQVMQTLAIGKATEEEIAEEEGYIINTQVFMEANGGERTGEAKPLRSSSSPAFQK